METVSHHLSFSSSPLLRNPKTQYKTSFLFQFCKEKSLSKSSYLHSSTKLKGQILDSIIEMPHRGDISVLMPVGGLCLFLYWISNFVVPGFIMKDLQKDENSEKNGGS